MRPPNSIITEEDLDFLDDFLISDSVGENAMTISELDGYLTGIVIGPDLIPF